MLVTERETHPVAIGVIPFGESRDGLLAAARSVGHVVRVQPVLRLLVHQLDHTPVGHLRNTHADPDHNRAQTLTGKKAQPLRQILRSGTRTSPPSVSKGAAAPLSTPPIPALTRRATASASRDAAIATASARRDLGGEEEEEEASALPLRLAAGAGAGGAVAAGGDRTTRARGGVADRSRASVRAP